MPALENIDRSSLLALVEISREINSIQDTDELLSKILQIAMQTLAAERGFILLQAPETETGFVARAAQNISPEAIADIAHISSSVVRHTLSGGEAVIWHDSDLPEGLAKTESIIAHHIRSVACAPLRLKNRLVGAIYLDSRLASSAFGETALPFLNAFANQAAIAIENARLYQNLREENRRWRAEVQSRHRFSEIIGKSMAMHQIFDVMERVLESHASVLIEGESGTGKELVARAIHYNGPRSEQPFVALFCGSLPETLLESELFGHKKGAFTGAITDKRGLFEVADGGTFFLDEIGDLTPTIQAKLLRVLQEGEIKRVGETHMRRVNVRIISATNKVLKEEVKTGRFREDLYYRLNVISIKMPALRERKDDIPLLAHHFLDRYAKENRKPLTGFSEKAMEQLRRYDWPGNVRELENAIERAAVLARSELITERELQISPPDAETVWEEGLTLAEYEKRVVMSVLRANDGHITQTAEKLGVSRRWLHYRLKEWGYNVD
ncbi:GAF domain-containing protein [candidate division KSB1 bacterium]|nr:MAG: GAF domain-containing protein [candidate division KSB1 bacterium]MCE7941064.1 GAF domain-containing protein [Chlorobi bacterium CHB1]MDL1877881.1 GAF domain-containing protein [Cytophagia bacterium CHB2]